MSDSPTLPIGPLPHIALDYARLRDEGLRLLGKLASAQWTDFNTHDPGITILEQLCYAITDLGYRTSYPVPDLLSGGDPGLPPPEAILTTDPVTLADIRKVALDVDGIGNAWVEDARPEPAFAHDAASGEIRLLADPGDPTAVQMRGIHRVVLQTTERLPGEAARVQVAARLHAGRVLGSDFDVALVQSYQVKMTAALEVDSVDDPIALMADILDAIDAYLAPRAQFRPIAEARAQGRALDAALDGPLLAHGEIGELPEQRRTVYMSDLLHAMLDVPAVKAVRSLILGSSRAGEQWSLDIPGGSLPTLDPSATITLLRNDLPLRVSVADGRRRLDERRAAAAAAASTNAAAPPPAPPRDLIRHRSIQYQLPAAYGVGALGLASSETPERRAQARQLAGYLLIFDQLFANALAQLAHVRDLLSPGDGSRTYFALPVEDARLDLDALIRDSDEHPAWLDDHVEIGDPRERRKRFLAHLLARYAEELGDHARVAPPGAADPDDLLIADRSAFLRHYPALSRGRGSGYDLSPDASDAGGFEDRLRHKLGLRDGERLYVVEHVLLRPVPEDVLPPADEDERAVPLLAGVSEPDPWSLHVSVVLAELEPPDRHGSFEQLVEQTVLAEAPAHLSVDLQWLGKGVDGVDDWAAFVTAWDAFRDAYRTYRKKRLAQEPLDPADHLKMRDARDRIIDLLGFGRTYPLRDLGVLDEIVVNPSSRATIAIGYSQQDVLYELHDRLTGKAILDGGVPVVVEGTGGPIEIVTPQIDVDTSYRILAVKRAGADTIDDRREAWLRTGPAPAKSIAIRVMEGVDAALEASIQLPVLDPRIDAPKPTDARIGDWGVRADVQILASQEGVTYTLIANAKDLSDPSKDRVLSAPVIGTSGTIVLRSAAIAEDVDLRIRGQRTTGTGDTAVVRTAVLDIVLPLRVRANPAVPAQLVPPVIGYGGAAVVKLDATQASVRYRVHRGRVRDRDFVFDATPPDPTIDIVGDGRTVRLQRPAKRSPWQDLPGFAPVGDATAGTGGTLNLAIGAPGTDDAFLVLQATKQHELGPLGTGSATVPSSVQLDAALALLVRPDPAPALRFTVTMASGATTGSLLVSGGQPGVFYELHLDGDPQAIGLPAYVHQRDDQSSQLNKGIEQLRIEVDAVVARDRTDPGASPATTPPLAPLIDTAHLSAGSVLAVQARKAMSGLGAPLARRAVLDDMPAVTAPASVASGASADIAIEASRAGERYWLIRDGQPVGDPQTGTGGKIVLSTGPLTQRTAVTVAATRPDAPGIAVERHVDVVVDVT